MSALIWCRLPVQLHQLTLAKLPEELIWCLETVTTFDFFFFLLPLVEFGFNHCMAPLCLLDFVAQI